MTTAAQRSDLRKAAKVLDAELRPGADDFMALCIVHPENTPSLHVSIGTKDLVVKCLGGCPQPKVWEAFQARLTGSTNGTGPTVHVTTPHDDEQPVAQDADARRDPKAWLAAKTIVSPKFLNTLPISFVDGWIRHHFDGTPVSKDRQAGTKERRWAPKGTHNPPIWPLPADMPEEGIFTEGETDCIALRGIGMDNVYAITGGASNTPTVEQWRDMRKRGLLRARIAFDADKAGREGREQAVTDALAAGLDVSTVTPPDYDSLSGTGKDWCEWVAAGGTLDAFPSEDARNALLTIDALAALMPTEYEWIVDPLLFPTGMTVIAGLPKSGKTTFVAGIAGDLGRGVRALLPAIRDPQVDVNVAEVRTIVLSEEPGPPLMDKHRLFRLRRDTVYYTKALALERGETASDVLLKARAQAKRWITEGHRVLIVVDSFEEWAGIKDENAAAEVAQAVGGLRAILATTGAAVIVIHHLRKGGGERGEGLRGSSALAGAFDLVVEYGETTGNDDRERGVNIRGRLDHGRAAQFMKVRLTEGSKFVLLQAGDGTAVINPRTSPMSKVGDENRDKVLEAMPGTALEIAVATRFAIRTVKGHLSELRKAGLAAPTEVPGGKAPRWERCSGVQAGEMT